MFGEVCTWKIPCQVVIGVRPGGDRRIGFAVISMPDANVDKWQPARQWVRGRDGKSRMEVQGLMVDSGHACYLDRRFLAVANEVLDTEDGRDTLFHEIDRNSSIDTYGFCAFDFGDDGRARMAVFSTGDGDGTYSSSVGLGSEGRPIAFVTNFLVFASPFRRADEEQ